jgi:hypothetical protein
MRRVECLKTVIKTVITVLNSYFSIENTSGCLKIENNTKKDALKYLGML